MLLKALLKDFAVTIVIYHMQSDSTPRKLMVTGTERELEDFRKERRIKNKVQVMIGIAFKFFQIVSGKESRNWKRGLELRGARKELNWQLHLACSIITWQDIVANLVAHEFRNKIKQNKF